MIFKSCLRSCRGLLSINGFSGFLIWRYPHTKKSSKMTFFYIKTYLFFDRFIQIVAKTLKPFSSRPLAEKQALYFLQRIRELVLIFKKIFQQDLLISFFIFAINMKILFMNFMGIGSSSFLYSNSVDFVFAWSKINSIVTNGCNKHPLATNHN